MEDTYLIVLCPRHVPPCAYIVHTTAPHHVLHQTSCLRSTRHSEWILNHLVRNVLLVENDNRVIKTSLCESHTGNPGPSSAQLRLLFGRRGDFDKQPRFQQAFGPLRAPHQGARRPAPVLRGGVSCCSPCLRDGPWRLGARTWENVPSLGAPLLGAACEFDARTLSFLLARNLLREEDRGVGAAGGGGRPAC